MKTFKRSVALLLSLLMLVSVFGATMLTAYADESTQTTVTGKIKVAVTSNNKALASLEYETAKVNTFTVNFPLQSADKILNGQGCVKFDSNVLELVNFEMPFVSNAVTNTKLYNEIRFNFSDVSNFYDFTTAKDLCVATFKPKGDCDTTVSLDMTELNATGDADKPLVTDGVVVGEYTVEGVTSVTEVETNPPTTESTKPTETEKPTEPKKPTIKAKKSTLKAGQKTTVKVSNASGKKITYSTSKKKVVSVDKKGNVEALGKGTAYIYAKVSGYGKIKCKIKVTTSPVLMDGKKKAKSIVVKKNGTKKITIKGKVSDIKNVYKNTKTAKIVSKTNASTLKVKGLKKGSTTISVKVNKYYTLKLKVKVK